MVWLPISLFEHRFYVLYGNYIVDMIIMYSYKLYSYAFVKMSYYHYFEFSTYHKYNFSTIIYNLFQSKITYITQELSKYKCTYENPLFTAGNGMLSYLSLLAEFSLFEIL